MSDTKISEARNLLAEAFGCDPEELLDGEVRAVRAVLALQSVKPQPAELAEQQGDQSGRIRELEQLNEILQKALDRQFASAEEVAALALQQDDRIEELEEALAATGKQQVGEACTHEWRTAGGGSQARRPVACAKCNQHRDHMPQQVGEVQGDARAQFEAWAKPYGHDLTRRPIGREGDDSYSDDFALYAWTAWQAALAARQPGARVPVAEVVKNCTGQVRIVFADGKTVIDHVGTKFYAAPPAQGIDLGQLWEPIKEAVHTALSVHVSALSQKKREQVAVYVARQLRDGQRDAAPGMK